MAQKNEKSQAEKAAQAKKKNTSAGKSKAPEKKTDRVQKGNPDQTAIPVRLISSVVSLGLFFLFVVMLLQPEGVVVQFIQNVILGLVGKVAFYVSIPALLYLFVIHAFSGKRPIKLRTVCLIVFVILSGCLSQLSMDAGVLPKDATVMKALYEGGAEGITAGLICGGLGLLMDIAVGRILSYVIFSIAALLTLLASFQITIPSIIRAVQNRPRADWENEIKEVEEPASVVVNHLANKRIEHIENRRRIQKERQELEMLDEQEDEQLEFPVKEIPPVRSRADEFMSQVEADVETPVGAAATPVEHDDIELILDRKSVTNVDNTIDMEPSPEEMLPFQKEAPVEKVTAKEARESAVEVAQEIEEAMSVQRPYVFPPIDLLLNPSQGMQDGTMEMRENTRRLNETLASFKIDAHIINVTRGPSVTRYEVELGRGVALNKLTTRADDIALSLGASGVRIAAVPGKISVVGIEVPNRAVTTVSLREVIDSNEFGRAKSKSSFAVGKDIGGACIVGNIAKLPHMLIAGTTGSGKSVCMNSIIISLLYKASPEDVKLIMIDPKMVELGIYNGIPHLLIPVVTDPKKAAGSLQWAVTEMMRRYKAMSDSGVRDLESYNSIVEAEGEGTKLPQVVVIIDELADLMLVAAKEVEESICRIAQMGRAAGIHLVIATQRPSADVITGLMKANIPSRIAFAVASAMESRIILDTQGAEKLVGKGDMLYAPIGAGKPLRVQGCFVSDTEVEAVATYVKENFVTDYDQQVMEEIERKASQTGNGKATAADPEPNADELDGDEMLPAAVDVILETGQASVSMLQRRLKLGYARAARIVDEMEEKGIVGPFQGSKPRSILITKEQWQAMRGGETHQMDFDDLEDDGSAPEELY